MDIIMTFDAIRGLPSEMADKIKNIIWETAEQDEALRNALVDAVNELLGYEKKEIERYRIMNDAGCPWYQGETDYQLAMEDIPW